MKFKHCFRVLENEIYLKTKLGGHFSISDPAYYSQDDLASQLCPAWSEEDIQLFFQGSILAVSWWNVHILRPNYQIYLLLYQKLMWYEFEAIWRIFLFFSASLYCHGPVCVGLMNIWTKYPIFLKPFGTHFKFKFVCHICTTCGGYNSHENTFLYKSGHLFW